MCLLCVDSATLSFTQVLSSLNVNACQSGFEETGSEGRMEPADGFIPLTSIAAVLFLSCSILSFSVSLNSTAGFRLMFDTWWEQCGMHIYVHIKD